MCACGLHPGGVTLCDGLVCTGSISLVVDGNVLPPAFGRGSVGRSLQQWQHESELITSKRWVPVVAIQSATSQAINDIALGHTTGLGRTQLALQETLLVSEVCGLHACRCVPASFAHTAAWCDQEPSLAVNFGARPLHCKPLLDAVACDAFLSLGEAHKRTTASVRASHPHSRGCFTTHCSLLSWARRCNPMRSL